MALLDAKFKAQEMHKNVCIARTTRRHKHCIQLYKHRGENTITCLKDLRASVVDLGIFITITSLIP
jgi:hypothetical protein